MRREANFIEFPGTGMWLMTSGNNIQLFLHIDKKDIKRIVDTGCNGLFWINRGTGAAQLLALAKGKKLSCATEVTPRILKQYLKE